MEIPDSHGDRIVLSIHPLGRFGVGGRERSAMMKANLRRVWPLALLGWLAGCSGTDTPTSVDEGVVEKRTEVMAGPPYEANPVVSPDGQWVYFEADADGDMEIFRVSLTGGLPEQLTVNTVFDSSPSVSPDGTHLVYESDLAGHRHIYALDLAQIENGPVALTSGTFDDAGPAWSPKQGAIVFESNRDKIVGLDLYLVSSAGADLGRLTTTAEGIYCRTADWSADGSHVVYESNATGWSALYTIGVAGGKGVQITPDAGYEGHPAWSPLGDVIAFESTRDGATQIYLTPATGGSWTQLTRLGGYWPQWSPDGTAIVYGVFDGANADVVTITVP